MNQPNCGNCGHAEMLHIGEYAKCGVGHFGEDPKAGCSCTCYRPASDSAEAQACECYGCMKYGTERHGLTPMQDANELHAQLAAYRTALEELVEAAQFFSIQVARHGVDIIMPTAQREFERASRDLSAALSKAQKVKD